MLESREIQQILWS